MNPNSKKPTSDVIAGKIGKPFIQSSARRLDMKAPVKGNLQGAQEKAVSRIVPTRAASWAGYTKPNQSGPPKSTNWRATTRSVISKG